MILLLALLLALISVQASGGNLRALANSRMRLEYVLLALFALQGVARGRLPYTHEWKGYSLVVWALTSIGLLTILLLNRRLPFLWLAAAGIATNLFVVLVNNGMPVMPPAETPVETGFYHLLGSQDVFPALSDVLPAGDTMLSLGDLLLFAGVSAFVLRTCSEDYGVDGATTRPSLRSCGGGA